MNNENCKGMSKDHIKGIKCGVKNCIYHDCDTYCTAEQISVSNSANVTAGDAACATFKEKK